MPPRSQRKRSRAAGASKRGAPGHQRANRTDQTRDVWDRLSERSQHLICVAVLLAVSFGFFAPVHFSGKSLIGGDTVNWRAMAQSSIEHREATGQEPLWSTNAFGGMPSYMINYPTVVPQVDNIPRWLRRFIWPSSHFIFLLIGTYLLVFFLTGNKFAGVLSSLAYGLTTYLPVILSVGHDTKFISLSFVPWVVLAFVYTMRRPKLISALLFAVALAANLRAGHIQPTYYMAFLLGVWWVMDGIAAVRMKDTRTFARATGMLALGGALAVLMVAQPYLAHAEYRAFTIRGAAAGGEPGGLDWSYAMSWSQGLSELLTLLVANAFGGGSPTYWGPKPFTEGPHYVGGVVLLLAVLALWQIKRRTVQVFGISALLMVLFSLGENLPLLNRPMFEFFPLFNAMRVPETWLSVAAFTLAVLGGFGAWYVVRTEPTSDDEALKTRRLLIASGVALALVFGLVVLRGALFDFEREGEQERVQQQIIAQQPGTSPDDLQVQSTARQYIAQLKDARAELFTDDAIRTMIFLLLAGALIYLNRRRVLPASAFLAALALLVVIDLWGVGRRHLNEDRLADARTVESRIREYDFDRFLVERRNEAGGMGRFRVISFEGQNPMTNARPSYFHESLGGYHGAKLRVYQDFIEHILFTGSYGINDQALDMLNARYLIAPNPIPGFEQVYRSEQTGMLVLENPNVLPRAFFVGKVEVVESAEATWDRIHEEEFDASETALLTEPLEFAPAPIDSGATARATLVSYSPREIIWDVETDAPRLLVISEVYYPAGWHATLDAEAVPIVRANYLLRAVPVPAGNHRIEMRFEPGGHRLGTWLAASSTALVYGATLVLLALPWVRRRRREGEG